MVSGDYNARAAFLIGPIFPTTPCISRVDGGLGSVRSFLTSDGAGKQLVSLNKYSSNFDSIFANPRARQFCSGQSPKKSSESNFLFLHFFSNICKFFNLLFELLINVEYENYYPKNKKEIPKANEQKSESKGTSASHCY